MIAIHTINHITFENNFIHLQIEANTLRFHWIEFHLS